MRKKITLFLLSFVMMSNLLWAAEPHCGVCEFAESQDWHVSAPGKITRGVTNLAFGWTNIFVQPFKEDDVLNGIGKGLANFFIRALQGVGEIGLFWLPPSPTEPLRQCSLGDIGVTGR